MSAALRAAQLASAWGIDRRLGDPPTALHPVGWIGHLIARLERAAPYGTAAAPAERQRFGAAIAAALPIMVAAGGTRLADLGPGRSGRSGRWGMTAGAVAGTATRLGLNSALLSTTIGQRTLDRRAAEVAAALAAGDLPQARALAGRHLVSRSMSGADAPTVAAATIESLAENLSDATVAPLLFAAAGGTGWALWYRTVNTLDAMWGYRDAPYTDLGRVPARLDDVANLLPARVTAAAICLAAARSGEWADGRGALQTWRADAGRTSSPNAGHPMAAMSGALGVRLEKPGHYVLGAAFPEPTASDIARARHLADVAATIVLGAVLGGLLGGLLGDIGARSTQRLTGRQRER